MRNDEVSRPINIPEGTEYSYQYNLEALELYRQERVELQDYEEETN
jgi:hypothetical protein